MLNRLVKQPQLLAHALLKRSREELRCALPNDGRTQDHDWEGRSFLDSVYTHGLSPFFSYSNDDVALMSGSSAKC